MFFYQSYNFLKKVNFSVVIYLILLLPLHAQDTLSLKLVGQDIDYHTPKFFLGAEALSLWVDSLNAAEINNGFLGFSVDSLLCKEKACTAYVFRGNKYKWSEIRLQENDAILLNRLGYKPARLEGKTLALEEINKISSGVLNKFNNQGYPFARVTLDSIVLNRDQVSSRLRIEKENYVTFDTIILEGERVLISKHFLMNYLQIKKGEPYIHKRVLETKAKLKDLGLFSLSKDPGLVFVNDKASLKLTLKKRRSSSFDFLIGLLRNGQDMGPRYTISGEFTADFRNKLGKGERFFAQFKRLKPETQQLKLAASYPYIFNSSYGLDGEFSLYREQADFIDFSAQLGVQYFFEGLNEIKLFYKTESSRLLEVDTTMIRDTLPDRLDISYSSVGLAIDYNKLDYRFNPKKGFAIQASAQIGYKKLIPNVSILELSNEMTDFQAQYDSIGLRDYQLQFALRASYFIPLLNNVSIKTSMNSAYKVGGSRINKNEFFRIGGNRLLRGFDEQSISASLYSVFTAELRFILAQESSNFTLSLPFVDYGAVYDPLEKKWDYPLGIGVGLQFETKTGLFTFAFAGGKSADIPFDFNNLKIHFGYVNLF